jgi:hypothetical protein
MGHRRFLPTNHAHRKRKKEFNGKTENIRAKYPLTGKQVYSRVKDLKVQLGKFKKKAVRKKGAPKISWKKRSIFWDLPYWEHLEVRHCLDVMHVVKNVCDSIVGTLLNIPGKTKDGINARKDMQFLNIRPDLQPAEKEREKGKTCTYLKPAMHTLSKAEKKSLCECLHGVKVPSGYSSNIKNLVSMEDLKLTGMKSHDCHVLMTQLLPVAIRGILPPPVRQTITKLCFFFNAICCKVTDPDTLDALQKEVVVTLCHLEMYFPPSFFDIMVHLTVHLIREIKMCGPVFLRYMYPFERYMGLLKGYVRNRYRPEGSIVRAYAAEEVIEFCTNYLDDVKAIGIPKSRHEGRLHGVGTIGGKLFVPDDKTMSLAHFHVLQHLTDVHPFWDEHMTLLRQQNPKKSDKWLIGKHNEEFEGWFTRRVMQASEGENIKETVKLLALGPVHVVRTFQGYDINGYTFYTRNQDSKSTVQNSGVTLVAVSSDLSDPRGAGPSHASMSYYGYIEEIWELDYRRFNIPLFMCKWVDNRRGVKVDDDGFILVDFSKAGYKDDPFILARQATQVFYVTDPADRSRHVVLSGKRRIIGIDNVEDEEAYDHFDEIPPFSTGMASLPAAEVNETGHMRIDHNEGEWVEEVSIGK